MKAAYNPSVSDHNGNPIGSVVLTPRELSVLNLLAEGHNNESISHQLGISANTVKKYVTIILRSFRCSNRTEVAITVLREKHAAELRKQDGGPSKAA